MGANLCYNTYMVKQCDTIGIIALAGACDKQQVQQAVQNIETLGFKVKLSKNIYEQERYLAGSDEGKLNELYDFFQDPESRDYHGEFKDYYARKVEVEPPHEQHGAEKEIYRTQIYIVVARHEHLHEIHAGAEEQSVYCEHDPAAVYIQSTEYSPYIRKRSSGIVVQRINRIDKFLVARKRLAQVHDLRYYIVETSSVVGDSELHIHAPAERTACKIMEEVFEDEFHELVTDPSLLHDQDRESV